MDELHTYFLILSDLKAQVCQGVKGLDKETISSGVIRRT